MIASLVTDEMLSFFLRGRLPKNMNACGFAILICTPLRKHNCNFRGMASGCPLFRGKNVWWSAVQREDFVRCPESGSIRFSEVANVLQLWYFQSVTRQVSIVAWVSTSRRVHYGRFHCIPCYVLFTHYVICPTQ